MKRLTCYKQVWQQIQYLQKKVNVLINILFRLISLFLRSAGLSSADTLPKHKIIFIIPISLYTFDILDLIEFIVKTLGCKDISIRKLEFVAKAKLIFLNVYEKQTKSPNLEFE